MNSNTPPPNVGRVTVNLMLIVLALAMISGWLLYYTDWFPLIGGLFTLSGVFAWLALVSNLLTEVRARQMRNAFDEKALQSKRAPYVLVSAMVVLALILAGQLRMVQAQILDLEKKLMAWHRASEAGRQLTPGVEL